MSNVLYRALSCRQYKRSGAFGGACTHGHTRTYDGRYMHVHGLGLTLRLNAVQRTAYNLLR